METGASAFVQGCPIFSRCIIIFKMQWLMQCQEHKASSHHKLTTAEGQGPDLVAQRVLGAQRVRCTEGLARVHRGLVAKWVYILT